MTAHILELPRFPCCQCGVRSAPLGEMCPGSDPDDPDLHQFFEPVPVVKQEQGVPT